MKGGTGYHKEGSLKKTELGVSALKRFLSFFPRTCGQSWPMASYFHVWARRWVEGGGGGQVKSKRFVSAACAYSAGWLNGGGSVRVQGLNRPLDSTRSGQEKKMAGKTLKKREGANHNKGR